MSDKLELQVRARKFGTDEEEWQTINRRQTGELSFTTCMGELLSMRDQWRLNEFPNHSFRIIQVVKGRETVLVA